jgi:hypothetical protein
MALSEIAALIANHLNCLRGSVKDRNITVHTWGDAKVGRVRYLPQYFVRTKRPMRP